MRRRQPSVLVQIWRGRYYPRRPVATLLLILATSCATVDTAVVANPGAEFSLSLGKTAAVTGTPYRITFNRVTEDSRCPADVTCVWAGDAKIELTIARKSAPADVRVVSLTPPNAEVTSGDLRIRFVGLVPAARQSEPAASRAYVAHLMVLTP
jgi:hypothetical protein